MWTDDLHGGRLAAERDDWKARYRDGMAEANGLRGVQA